MIDNGTGFDNAPADSGRRRLIRSAAAAGACLCVPGLMRTAWAHGDAPHDGLFTLGVASGDPSAQGVVLWTRLVPDPLNGGGMGPLAHRVRWRIARDPAMRELVRGGEVDALPEHGHAVNVHVQGLAPDRWYYYQFSYRGTFSRIGRTRTFP
ncbi:MAG: PhoD-like phosphatase N-terminal domain-containing protein, partial [Gammaproteobacteria bacterium]